MKLNNSNFTKQTEQRNIERFNVQRPQPQGGAFTRSLLESKWREGEAVIGRTANEIEAILQNIEKIKNDPAVEELRRSMKGQLEKKLQKLSACIQPAQKQALNELYNPALPRDLDKAKSTGLSRLNEAHRDLKVLQYEMQKRIAKSQIEEIDPLNLREDHNSLKERYESAISEINSKGQERFNEIHQLLISRIENTRMHGYLVSKGFDKKYESYMKSMNKLSNRIQSLELVIQKEKYTFSSEYRSLEQAKRFKHLTIKYSNIQNHTKKLESLTAEYSNLVKTRDRCFKQIIADSLKEQIKRNYEKLYARKTPIQKQEGESASDVSGSQVFQPKSLYIQALDKIYKSVMDDIASVPPGQIDERFDLTRDWAEWFEDKASPTNKRQAFGPNPSELTRNWAKWSENRVSMDNKEIEKAVKKAMIDPLKEQIKRNYEKLYARKTPIQKQEGESASDVSESQIFQPKSLYIQALDKLYKSVMDDIASVPPGQIDERFDLTRDWAEWFEDKASPVKGVAPNPSELDQDWAHLFTNSVFFDENEVNNVITDFITD